MQALIGWAIVGVVVFAFWRLWRRAKRALRHTSQARAEAFSNAVSSAVQEGVQAAVSAAIADASAAATGGNVNLHINNLARILADYDHDAVRPYADQSNHVEPRGSDVGSVSDAARRGELASGRAVRRSDTDSPNRSSVRVTPTNGRR